MSQRGHGNLLVRLVDVLNGQDSQTAVVSEIPQGDTGAGLDLELVNGLLRQVERDRNAEKHAIGETAILDNAAEQALVSAPNRAN